jgi:hypothetical protein
VNKLFYFLLGLVAGALLLALLNGWPQNDEFEDTAAETDLEFWVTEVARDLDSKEATAATTSLEAVRVLSLEESQSVLKKNKSNPAFQNAMIRRMHSNRQQGANYAHYAEEFVPYLYCKSIGLDDSRLLEQTSAHWVQLTDVILALFSDGSQDRETWRQAFAKKQGP